MQTDTLTHFQLIFQQLKRFGFLLESDPKLPSVVTLITGEPLKKSWWSHPMGQTIFAVNEKLEDHKDVLITKLVAGKVTFVHRKLWPEVISIGTARESWQTKTLSASARSLLQLIEERGAVITNELPPIDSGKVKAGDLARELEKKLLINAAQVHTASGAHAKALETWEHWAKRVGFKGPQPPTASARKSLEDRLLSRNQEFGASAKLPWQ